MSKKRGKTITIQQQPIQKLYLFEIHDCINSSGDDRKGELDNHRDLTPSQEPTANTNIHCHWLAAVHRGKRKNYESVGQTCSTGGMSSIRYYSSDLEPLILQSDWSIASRHGRTTVTIIGPN